MNGNSKREKLDAFFNARIREAFEAHAFEYPNDADALRRVLDGIKSRIKYRIIYDPYRFKELKDIMEWKRPPKEQP